MMPLTREDVYQLIDEAVERAKKAFSDELDKKRYLPAELHTDHHEFVQLLIDERKLLNERREALRRHVTAFLVLSIIGGIGSAVLWVLWDIAHKVVTTILGAQP